MRFTNLGNDQLEKLLSKEGPHVQIQQSLVQRREGPLGGKPMAARW